jgi:hypothetical protein
LNKLIILSLLIIALAGFASAETQLLCLDNGQTVAFSECNPLIADRVCDSTFGCQYCVDYNALTGVYCPSSINACNAVDNLECSPLGGTNNTNTTIPGNSTNSTGQNNTNTTIPGNSTNISNYTLPRINTLITLESGEAGFINT